MMGRLWIWALYAASLIVAGEAGADVEILSPQEGAELSGKVEAIARVTPPRGQRLDRMIAQAENGETIRLEPGGPGIYSALLDTTRLPNGKQTLLVIESTKGMDKWLYKPTDASWASLVRNFTAEVRVTVRNPYRFFWGDLHAHTSYSDGCRTPQEAYEFARNKAKLDFFAVTDHSDLLTFEEYADVIAQADRFNQPGEFVTLYGAESTEETGHLCLYQSPTPRLSSRRDAIYQALGRMQLLGQFNHPAPGSPSEQGPRNDFLQFHHSPAADRSMALVELRSAPEEAAYIAMLDAGWHVGASGSEDQHEAKWGMGDTWVVALARELTRESIMEALWARRTYSAADRNLQLTFTLDGEDMGAQVTRTAGSYDVMVVVSDPDENDAVDAIELFLDGKTIETVWPKLREYAWAMPVKLTPGRHYVFVRVTQIGGRKSWSSPIWINAY